MQEQVDIRYLLRIYALGPHPELEISHEAFEGIKSSKAILNAGLSMEEKYEVLVSNYLEFEKEMLIYSAECMIRNNLNTDAFSKIKMDLNRRLVNIMTAARSYIDQVSRDIRSIVPHEIKENDFVKKALSDKYDELFEYRFMESLRNHVQHREFPVHYMEINRFWDNGERAQGSGLAFDVELASEKADLSQNLKFKTSVLEEMPERVDLKKAVRVYIEAISDVHSSLRHRVLNALTDSRENIDTYIGLYARKRPNPIGLYAIREENGIYVEKVSLSTEWDDVRQKLTQINMRLVNLSRRYVTSKLTLKKENKGKT